MKKIQFQIIVKTKTTLEHIEGEATSKFIRTDNLLDFSGPVDQKKYFRKDDLPNADGCLSITLALVNAIANNIHYAHEEGYRDSAEHLRYIIKKLEEQFIAVPNITKGNFEDKP